MLGPKQPRFRSEKWLRAVADGTCVICDTGDQSQAAHENFGKGMAMKVDDCLTARICPSCHTDIDQGKDLTREERRLVMMRAILDTIVQLAREGRLVVK